MAGCRQLVPCYLQPASKRINMKDKIERIARKIAERGKNVVFTGAGISTESGIPDYRSQGGIWDKFRPPDFNKTVFDEFMSSEASRIEFWRQKTKFYYDLIKAKPNAAHLAISELHQMGLLETLITQNIDGLHQASGLPEDKIIELHGNTCRVRCMSCGKLYPLDETHKRIESGDLAPECECGGYLKSDTVSFGQSMPFEEVEKAVKYSQSCDFFLVVGSTLLVQPAASMPYYAKESGAFLGIVNLSETPCDNMCDVLIRGKAGEVMTEIISAVKSLI